MIKEICNCNEVSDVLLHSGLEMGTVINVFFILLFVSLFFLIIKYGGDGI